MYNYHSLLSTVHQAKIEFTKGDYIETDPQSSIMWVLFRRKMHTFILGFRAALNFILYFLWQRHWQPCYAESPKRKNNSINETVYYMFPFSF